MYAQVNPSCYKSYSYIYFINISIDLTAKIHVKPELNVGVCAIILKGLLLAKKIKNYQSDVRRHVVDCVQQVCQQRFDHVDMWLYWHHRVKCDLFFCSVPE